jgi:hypothetical protein
VLLSKGQPPALSGYHLAFLVGSCLVALAALTALLIRDEDAASTIAAPAPVAEAAV